MSSALKHCLECLGFNILACCQSALLHPRASCDTVTCLLTCISNSASPPDISVLYIAKLSVNIQCRVANLDVSCSMCSQGSFGSGTPVSNIILMGLWSDHRSGTLLAWLFPNLRGKLVGQGPTTVSITHWLFELHSKGTCVQHWVSTLPGKASGRCGAQNSEPTVVFQLCRCLNRAINQQPLQWSPRTAT